MALKKSFTENRCLVLRVIETHFNFYLIQFNFTFNSWHDVSTLPHAPVETSLFGNLAYLYRSARARSALRYDVLSAGTTYWLDLAQ